MVVGRALRVGPSPHVDTPAAQKYCIGITPDLQLVAQMMTIGGTQDWSGVSERTVRARCYARPGATRSRATQCPGAPTPVCASRAPLIFSLTVTFGIVTPDCAMATYTGSSWLTGRIAPGASADGSGSGAVPGGCWGVAMVCIVAGLAGHNMSDPTAFIAFVQSDEFKRVECVCVASLLSCYDGTSCTPDVSPFLNTIAVGYAATCPASGSTVTGAIAAIGSVVVAVAGSVASSAAPAACA